MHEWFIFWNWKISNNLYNLKQSLLFCFISEAKNCALIQENVTAKNDSFQDMGFALAKASAFFRELI